LLKTPVLKKGRMLQMKKGRLLKKGRVLTKEKMLKMLKKTRIWRMNLFQRKLHRFKLASNAHYATWILAWATRSNWRRLSSVFQSALSV
jgi:hypothetical protein